MVDYLQAHLSGADFEAFSKRVAAAAEQIGAMTQHEHIHTNVLCPAVVEGKCVGYSARPMMCRKYHAIDLSDCQRAYDHPSVDGPRRTLHGREVSGSAHLSGWQAGLKQHGYDAGHYELIKALHEAITSSEAKERFVRKESAFTFEADR